MTGAPFRSRGQPGQEAITKQNKYDDEGFFAAYAQMPRSVYGLNAAKEWPVFRAMMPDLSGKRVLDIGCGFGWHCRYASEQRARSVVGIDISTKMLDRAQGGSTDPVIEYRRLAIEDMDFAAEEFDVVVSSLALHYVERFDLVCEKICRCLTERGSFVFSVEHPIFTAIAAQDWCYGPQGEKLHWPVDDYHDEGPRQTRFLDNDVIKYHRTLASHANALIQTGFRITTVNEFKPTEEALSNDLDQCSDAVRRYVDQYRDAFRRPMFLMVAAVKD